MTPMNPIQFSTVDEKKFFPILNKRVNQYFKEHKIKKKGNWSLYTKAIIMFSLYAVPLILIFTVDMPQWLMLIMCIVAGVGMAGALMDYGIEDFTVFEKNGKVGGLWADNYPGAKGNPKPKGLQ